MGGRRLKEKGVDGRRLSQAEGTAHAKVKLGETHTLVKELKKAKVVGSEVSGVGRQRGPNHDVPARPT